MVYITYAALAVAVVFLAVKCANYVDMIDKLTSLSGAFIGGVILAAVTSLPELFTSISSVAFLDQPGLVMGNIFGSNIFNLAILGLMMVIFNKTFSSAPINNSHLKTLIFSVAVYIVIAVTVFCNMNYSFMNISASSVIVLVFYVLSVKFMASAEGSEGENGAESNDTVPLTLKQVIVRFVIASLLLIGASILITYATDALAAELGLGATLAGAIFLGVATSLPELASTITLFRVGNANAAVGNIVGSNMFNFTILVLADILYRKGTIYITDSQTRVIILFGLVAAVIAVVATSFKVSKKTSEKKLAPLYMLLGILIIASYVAFIVMSN